MHLETLQVFCDLVESGSFSAAASQNFVTQSAVSQQVRTLEARFDQRLIERTKGRVQPTPAGQLLYQASKDITARYRELREQLQSFGTTVSGSVRLATVHSVGLYELSEPLKKFLKAYPQVNVHLEYSRSTKIFEDVLSGRIDLGIVAYPARRSQISVIPFREDRLVLVCATHHPLARRRSATIADLEGQTFVGYERDVPTRREFDRVLRRKNVTVRYVMELDNIETIKRVVEIGAGLAIVPEPTIKQEVKSRTLCALQITDETLMRPLGIVHRQGRHFSPAVERFIAELR
ncbi:MAG: LysR family transcriptional regulator [Deltaproteobacteria bacterium]|nr:LysR family transcriptional regulator [Deltaproteobacteria bacterium]